jgi:hypothetical protein
MRPAILSLGACVSLLGCDPGWVYKVAGATPVQDEGLRYVVPATGGLRVRVHQEMFAGDLTTELEVTDLLESPLTVTPGEAYLYDARVTAIARRLPAPPLACAGWSSPGPVILARADTCKISIDSVAAPDRERLDHVYLVHRGLVRAGQMIPLTIVLEAKD